MKVQKAFSVTGTTKIIRGQYRRSKLGHSKIIIVTYGKCSFMVKSNLNYFILLIP